MLLMRLPNGRQASSLIDDVALCMRVPPWSVESRPGGGERQGKPPAG